MGASVNISSVYVTLVIVGTYPRVTLLCKHSLSLCPYLGSVSSWLSEITTMASTASSRRNSNAASTGGSRRGSVDSDGGFAFPTKLKKGKPVSQVKLVFMGKTMVSTAGFNDLF